MQPVSAPGPSALTHLAETLLKVPELQALLKLLLVPRPEFVKGSLCLVQLCQEPGRKRAITGHVCGAVCLHPHALPQRPGCWVTAWEAVLDTGSCASLNPMLSSSRGPTWRSPTSPLKAALTVGAPRPGSHG